MIDEKIKKILEQFKINPAKALWDCHGTQIMYHRYIEEIGASAGVQVIKYETIKADESTAIVKCHARLASWHLRATAQSPRRCGRWRSTRWHRSSPRPEAVGRPGQPLSVDWQAET